jgi:hypothetical protein
MPQKHNLTNTEKLLPLLLFPPSQQKWKLCLEYLAGGPKSKVPFGRGKLEI